MADGDKTHPYSTIGSKGDDTINLQGPDTNPELVNGNSGSDSLTTGGGDDLAAGDMVSREWQFINGQWVYDPSVIQSYGQPVTRDYDDWISTGDGKDVLLGNGGNDTLHAGAGNDLINAGKGVDDAFGGEGDDKINLEQGNDYAEGGVGADTINAGSGDDVIYGDLKDGNVLTDNDIELSSFAQFADTGSWTMEDVDGISSISQSANTEPGKDYTISFELAANLAGGHSSGKVEVLWNGEVVDTVSVSTGVYETHEVTVTSNGEQGNLTFRAVTPDDAVQYNFDGPVVSYEKEMDFGDGPISLNAIAPGQAKLYQVINGDLKVFDPEEREYVDAGVSPGFKINAVGFNTESDLLYGVAKSGGVDALGNPVKSTDIVAIDATGAAYRVGKGGGGDFVGDFDNDGNLWTFQYTLDRVSVVDVDNLDANGDPQITHYNLPNGLFKDKTYDLAYNTNDNCFYAVIAPNKNGQEGEVVRIDLNGLADGDTPQFDRLPISGTLYGDEMASGMSKGAYGAVFMDGDGNLYYGLNKGDHDLDGSTGTSGAIYKVNMDWDTGTAYSEFMSETPSTSSNDGAVDPRSADAFAEIDADAAVLLRKPELIEVDPEGGNDKLRGGSGNDEIHGGGGDDTLQGGSDNDTLSGDSGNDRLYGGSGDDIVSGGSGKDHLIGGNGSDVLDGGSERDYLNAGSGNDTLHGGSGDDKIVGGAGSDVIHGGSGNDHMWGGKWAKDTAQDTFVVSGGSGKDMIHDFETTHDQIDLSAYGLDYDELQSAMTDKGWAVEIDLSGFNGGQEGDKLLLKSVKSDDLDESNFIL